MSGGVTVNDALFHVGQHDLPFGGVGDLGMGHYHGKEGFQDFLQAGVLHQVVFDELGYHYAAAWVSSASKMLAFLTR